MWPLSLAVACQHTAWRATLPFERHRSLPGMVNGSLDVDLIQLRYGSAVVHRCCLLNQRLVCLVLAGYMPLLNGDRAAGWLGSIWCSPHLSIPQQTRTSSFLPA